MKILDVGIRGWGSGVKRGGEEGNVGIEAIVGKKRGEGGSRVLGIVVAEFRQGKEAAQSVCCSSTMGGVEGEGASLPVDAGVVAGQPREAQDQRDTIVFKFD